MKVLACASLVVVEFPTTIRVDASEVGIIDAKVEDAKGDELGFFREGIYNDPRGALVLRFAHHRALGGIVLTARAVSSLAGQALAPGFVLNYGLVAR
ncbi:MAG: hypothetical protein ACYDAN_14260 [Candidatus Limnocylindrales bacterium]